MAGRTRLFAVAALLALLTLSCSSGGDEDVAALDSVESSTTATAEPTTTTTTAAITTTLSAQRQAEADVAQVAEDYWTSPTDTSEGMYGLEFTTGILETRIQGSIDRHEANGRLVFNDKRNPFEIISIDVDLEQGEAEVKACQSSYAVLLDANTRDELFVSDHEFLATSEYYLELTEQGWKIYEYIGTAEDDNPERCEISS